MQLRDNKKTLMLDYKINLQYIHCFGNVVMEHSRHSLVHYLNTTGTAGYKLQYYHRYIIFQWAYQLHSAQNFCKTIPQIKILQQPKQLFTVHKQVQRAVVRSFLLIFWKTYCTLKGKFCYGLNICANSLPPKSIVKEFSKQTFPDTMYSCIIPQLLEDMYFHINFPILCILNEVGNKMWRSLYPFWGNTAETILLSIMVTISICWIDHWKRNILHPMHYLALIVYISYYEERNLHICTMVYTLWD